MQRGRKQTRVKTRGTTEDVIGKPERPKRIPSKWREHYKHLLELRDFLAHRQADLTKDALEEQPTFSTHIADAATDTYDRDFALGMLSSEQSALYQTEQALNRIRNGTYGICELTGKAIEPARLEAIPWTRFSASAEKQLEREGTFKRARLGPRETVVKASATQQEPDEG